jgi:hypothetical protein
VPYSPSNANAAPPVSVQVQPSAHPLGSPPGRQTARPGTATARPGEERRPHHPHHHASRRKDTTHDQHQCQRSFRPGRERADDAPGGGGDAVREQTPPPQEQGEQQSGQQNPNLAELAQKAEDLAEQIRKHLERGPK